MNLISIYVWVWFYFSNKPHDIRQLGRGKCLFTLSLSHSQSLREFKENLKAKTWKQELKQRPWSNFAYWFFHGWFNSIQPKISCLKVAIPTLSWALLFQSFNQEDTHRLAYRPMWCGRSLLNWDSLLTDESGLGEVDSKLTSTDMMLIDRLL